MDSETVSTKSIDKTTSAEESTTESNVIVKLRRLKIEENLLTKNICKSSEVISEDIQDTLENNCIDNKRLCSKLKDSYIEIRDLFEEIQANTIFQDNLQSVDIDDVKKNVLNLENKIQFFKSSLQTKLNCLKSAEQDLMKEGNEENNNIIKLKRPNKVQIRTISEIVPSPVKTLINSPFKSPEVQELQEFIAHSKNRYGGWILYNHEIFEKEWHKHFSTHTNIEDFEYQEVNVENSESFQIFLHDVSVKLPGVKKEDILAHNKWYTKYYYLKQRQNRALEKWRLKKRILKSTLQKTKSKDVMSVKIKKNILENSAVTGSNNDTNYDKDNVEFQDLLNQTLYDTTISYERVNMSSDAELPSFFDDASKLSSKPHLTYMNPTNQWNNRCNDESGEYNRHINDVVKIRKRRVPAWRLVLQTD